MAYNLSEKAIAEKYEDLLFTKVMALYAEEESEKILSELGEETADPKAVQKLFDKKERSENLRTLWKYSKKVLQFAAMVVFVAVVSLSSVVVASAEAREAVAEAIYHLMIEEYDRYTEVGIGNSTGFIDPEIYDWEGAYAPTYIPEGFVFTEKQELTTRAIVTYSNGEQYFTITQSNKTANLHMDTENAQKIEAVKINDSAGLLVEKDGFSSLAWNDGNNFFWLRGEADSAELIKIAEGIKPIGNYAKEPEEEYTFVDPEIYTWENAYGLTYMAENYNLYSAKDLEHNRIVNYMQGEKYISFVQYIDTTVATDTEDADIVKEIQIGKSKGFLVVKDDWSCVFYSVEDILLQVSGTAPTEEIIKVAEGIRPIN